MRRAGARNRERAPRRWAAVAASLILHGLALGWLGVNIARLRANDSAKPEATPLEVRLAVADRATDAPLSRAAAGRPAAPAAAAAARAVVRSSETGRPAPASAAAGPPASSVTPPGNGPPGGRPGDAGEADGVRGALRGLLGCAHAGALDLSPAERARCDERTGLASRAAPRIDAIPAEKRRYYDAVAQAYAETHFYGTPSPWAGTRPGGAFKTPFDDWKEGVPPGHTANVGCSPLVLLPGYRPRPHSQKLGPCVITPPRGTFTEEADIPDPPTLREREADAAHMRRLDPPKP